nr:IS200/IS605 family transposase [Sphingobium sp. AntQ-1]
MGYSSVCHTILDHRYHLFWVPKYRFNVLHGEVRLRVREIIRQVCAEMGVTIVHGALSRDHVHMCVEIPSHVSVSDFMRRAKGRSSRKIHQEFEHIRKRYWGQRFWQRGHFSTTSAPSQMTLSCAPRQTHGDLPPVSPSIITRVLRLNTMAPAPAQARRA